MQVLLNFPSLKILYLHANGIDDLDEVQKLSTIGTLLKLTLHGNPIEQKQCKVSDGQILCLQLPRVLAIYHHVHIYAKMY